MRSGIVVVGDICGRITSWSAGAEKVVGIPASEIVGRHFTEIFIDPGNEELAKDIMVETLHRGKRWEGEFPLVNRSGVRVPGYATVEPTRDPAGNVTGTVSVFEPAHEEAPEQAFADYLLKERGLAHLTAYTYEHSLRTLERWLDKPRDDVVAADMRRFMRESDYHPGTKNGVLRALKAYRKFGIVEGWWEVGPIDALSGPKVPHNPKKALGGPDALKLLGACRRSNEFRVIALGLLAGLRVSESAALEASSWEPDRIRVEKGKGGKAREVPVHPLLAELRPRILERPRTSDGALKHTCRSLAHVTRIPFTSHTLRRTFSQRMAELGIGREVIGALLGHAPLSVTETYAPVTWDERRRAIARLGYSG